VVAREFGIKLNAGFAKKIISLSTNEKSLHHLKEGLKEDLL
jgi:hypothetical protein